LPWAIRKPVLILNSTIRICRSFRRARQADPIPLLGDAAIASAQSIVITKMSRTFLVDFPTPGALLPSGAGFLAGCLVPEWDTVPAARVLTVFECMASEQDPDHDVFAVAGAMGGKGVAPEKDPSARVRLWATAAKPMALHAVSLSALWRNTRELAKLPEQWASFTCAIKPANRPEESSCYLPRSTFKQQANFSELLFGRLRPLR